MASLEVHREFGGLTDHLRTYKVVIDRAAVGRLHPGESESFDVAPGLHELFIRIDWGRSEKIEVEVAAGERAKFHCAPRANIWTNLYWATFGWRNYVVLTRTAD